MDFDVIVIGSGFGGAVTSCRLAEKGKKVLVLERGKKWDRTTYPREPQDEWIWSHVDPEQYHGWTDLRRFKGMAVIAGAGVGGGSLIYANVSAVPPESVFESGWPPEITFAVLQSYYATVADVLDIRSEEHTSELQSQSNLVCRLLLEKKKKKAMRQECQPYVREHTVRVQQHYLR